MKYKSGDVIYAFDRDGKLHKLIVDRYNKKYDVYRCNGNVNLFHENEMFDHPLDAIYNRRAMIVSDIALLQTQLYELDDMIIDYEKGLLC